jgi:hypothetical protein
MWTEYGMENMFHCAAIDIRLYVEWAEPDVLGQCVLLF